MKKTKKLSKNAMMKEQREQEKFALMKAERTLITDSISSLCSTAEFIAVEPEFKEVNFCVFPQDYDRMCKSAKTPAANFKFERGDSDTYMLYYSYTLN